MTGFCIFMTAALLVSCWGIAGAREEPAEYDLSVSFDIRNNILRGAARITFPDDGERIVAADGLNIVSIAFNKRPFVPDILEGRFRVSGKGTLEVTYEVHFEKGVEMLDLENVGVVSRNSISAEGISLTRDWYPSLSGMAYWSLEALVPDGFMAVSEADAIHVTEAPGGNLYTFSFPYPIDGITLVAGPYVETKGHHQGIEVYAYFFPEDVSLAPDYVEHAERYLSLYTEILGPYPYRRFSIVENILPTGYSLPTFTLLGREVVRLPFIAETSLGHEIVHQWLGNRVYPDYQGGNWVEGLTTYLSDHLYEEQKGEGWRYRKKMLTDYQSYVTPSKAIPLKEFYGRTDFASSAVGYGKGAMFFHMLEEVVGRVPFTKALRLLIEEKKHARASWTDLQTAFKGASGMELEWFFRQWLSRKDIPSLRIEDARALISNGTHMVSFEVIQETAPYRLNLPFRVITEGGEIRDTLRIEKEGEAFRIPVPARPLSIVFDRDYHVMRTLTPDEFPPVIARLLGDETRMLVFPEGEEGKYAALIDLFTGEGFAVKEEGEVKDQDIQSSSMLVLGTESPILTRLFGKIDPPGTGFSLTVRRNPLNAGKVIAYTHGDSKGEIDPVVRRIFRYGKYSSIRFEGGKNVEKVIAKTDRGMVFSLYEPVFGINPRNKLALSDIIQQVVDTPIIYVGERHSNYEDHKVQLELITALSEKGRRFAIGMEMFQVPFQKALDEYLAGAINEREFLRASEYFKRWRFDYPLYREIIDFAKARGIHIIALNIREEITKKVTQGGLDALTEEERGEIPRDMDMADEAYKEKLKGFFELHQEFNVKNFENFYQAQILWDETMAHSIARFMDAHPNHQMVVLAGAQHIIFSSGIPQRAQRLTNREYATLINGEFSGLDSDIGDFLIFPPPMEAPESPKLGVMLDEEDGEVRIKELSPGSAASKAGLKKGDALLSVDGWEIESIQDVKIGLFDHRNGETITVTVSRSRFPFGRKVLELPVTL
ncbi:MAG: ChaN family lipoprotein [bacterium]